jgi:hypothetical protein
VGPEPKGRNTVAGRRVRKETDKFVF